MYYATQTNVPGAPGNLSAFTPPPMQPPTVGMSMPQIPSMQGFNQQQNNYQVVTPSVNTSVLTMYSSAAQIGNMAGLHGSANPQLQAEYAKLGHQYVT